MQESQDSGQNLNNIVAAAHELKAPLALIRQLALSLELDENCPSDVNASLRTSQSAIVRRIILTSERALRSTSDITRAARLDDSLFETVPVNPISICNTVSRQLQPLYDARGRSIKAIERAQYIGQYQAIANTELLSRIVTNFCDNALHYGTRETPIEMNVSRVKKGSVIRIGVRDYGPALPYSFWQQLRARLGVSAQPLHQRPDSSGLGLQLCRQFADAMNAQIGLIRHTNGTSFYVDLPACRQLTLL